MKIRCTKNNDYKTTEKNMSENKKIGMYQISLLFFFDEYVILSKLFISVHSDA